MSNLPSGTNRSPSFERLVGIGTSVKKIQAYIAELKSKNVALLIDVRAHPFSRFHPHFNRERLKAALKEEGIDYEWLGPTLGNPKNEQGLRTMKGFEQQMKQPVYEEGLQQALKLIERIPPEKAIAFTCAEKEEKDCHRQYILRDLKERLGLPSASPQGDLFGDK